MSRNVAASMTASRAARADEFYTRYEDIAAEVEHYPDAFRGKTVLLSADAEWSNFWCYFDDRFDDLGIERLIATHHSDTEPVEMIERTRAGVAWHRLEGNGDFRSPEVTALLEESDIVVTNPPFSLFREFVTQLVEHEKDFLILGNMNAMKYREVFPHVAAGRIWWGPSIRSGDRPFRVPSDYPLEASGCWEETDGSRWIRVKGVRWFTTLDHAGRHEPVTLTARYSESEYPRFDNFDAINVGTVASIPSDYDGLMGVPITFLGKHDPEQFEIVDLLNRYAVLDSQGTNETVRGSRSHTCNIGGKAVFSRVVIRRKTRP